MGREVAQSGWMTSTPVLMESGTAVWQGLFTPAQLDALERRCDGLVLEAARINGYGIHPVRTTQVAWLHRTADTEDLYLRVEAVVLRLNAELFRCDLSGLLPFQFAVYRAEEQGYFDWHSDYGRDPANPGQEPRKITLSLQLSDGAAYEGGSLEVRAAFPLDVVPRERGTLAAFRANALHRVTPVTKGVRKALVMWAAGPEFR